MALSDSHQNRGGAASGTTTMAADVFISYSRKDREVVLPWVQQLRDAGVSLWIDESGIDGASPWAQEIVEAIERCKALLLMLSPVSAASVHVVREVNIASEGEKPILPLLLEPVSVPAALRYPLAGIQQIDLFRGNRNDKIENILRSLNRLGIETIVGPSASPQQDFSEGLPRPFPKSGPAVHEPTPPPRQRPPLLQPPSAAYDPRWYIVRAGEEERALSYLDAPGAPAVIWGPEQFGKTWLLKHLIRTLRRPESGPCQIVALNLDEFGAASRSTLDNLLRELAARIVDQLNEPAERLEESWRRPGDSNSKLTWLIGRRILPETEGRLVLAIDRADAVWGSPFQDDLFCLLRGWAESGSEEPWSRLRMVLAISSTPAHLSRNTARSPFNVTLPIFLDDLGPGQVKELADRHGLQWTDEEIERIRGLVGGHPYLVRLVMYEAARPGAVLERLLAESIRDDSIFAAHLRHRLTWLEESGGLLDVLRGILGDPNSSIDGSAAHRLQKSGLIRQAGGSYQIRYQLYDDYFRRRLWPRS